MSWLLLSVGCKDFSEMARNAILSHAGGGTVSLIDGRFSMVS
jgi:hypothetical protein